MRLYIGRSSTQYYISDKPLVLRQFGKTTKFIFPDKCRVRVKLGRYKFEKISNEKLEHNRQHIFKINLEKLI